jgi:3-oxoacyl-[acyl-carrier-protein] synthase III
MDGMSVPPAIVGTGFFVPPQVRDNDDPIFRTVPPGEGLFDGYDERRVLGPGESVGWLMIEAGRAALQAAALEPSAVDILLGYGSVSRWVTPNVLAEVHDGLGLGARVPALPLADDFTNFNSAVIVADALIRTGSVKTALIACGGNWTQHVDYHTEQAISAGDGAGAAVIAPSTDPRQWTLVDHEHVTESAWYGAMYMDDTFQITQQGVAAFRAFGGGTAPTVMEALLDRNQIEDAASVTLITHQASSKLIDAWGQRPRLSGARFLNTIKQYGNPVLAGVPITLAALGGTIQTDSLILFCLGVQQQASAVLLERQPSAASTSETLAAAPQAR